MRNVAFDNYDTVLNSDEELITRRLSKSKKTLHSIVTLIDTMEKFCKILKSFTDFFV